LSVFLQSYTLIIMGPNSFIDLAAVEIDEEELIAAAI
jgi:hypothetical protein